MECILTKQKGQTLAAHYTMSRQGFSVGKKGIMTENREQKGMEASISGEICLSITEGI